MFRTTDTFRLRVLGGALRSGWVVITPADVYDGESATLLFVETYPANVWSDNDSFEGMCPGMHVARATVERTFWDGAVLSQQRSRLYYPPTGLYEYDAHRVPAAARGNEPSRQQKTAGYG